MGDVTSYGPFDVIGFLDKDSAVANLVRAVDDETGQPCLVEWYTRAFSADPARLRAFDEAARFYSEADLPGVLAVDRFGVAAGHAYLVHSWVEGATVRHLLEPGPEDPKPSHEVAGRLVGRLCEALKPLHSGAAQMAFHGNVVAERVVVSLDGLVRLLGGCSSPAILAGDRDPNVRLETATRAPEVLAGEPASPRVDVYQLGLLLYELLVGRPAFVGGADLELAERIQGGEILPPRSVNLGIPEELAACTVKALSLDPAARFADANEMGAALKVALMNQGLLAGKREVAEWARRLLGDEAGALAAPAPRPARRRPKATPSGPMPALESMPAPDDPTDAYEPGFAGGVSIESDGAPRRDPSIESLEIELDGDIERDDGTMELELDTGEILQVEAVKEPTMDLTLEGAEQLESEEISAPLPANATPSSITPIGTERPAPKAPPPRKMRPPDGMTPSTGTKPLSGAVAPSALTPAETGAPSRPSAKVAAPAAESPRRADPTPAGLQRKVNLGARLAVSAWGRRVVSTLEMRRGPAPQRILYGDSTEFPPGRDFLGIISSAVETVARTGAVEGEVHAAWEAIEKAKAELGTVDGELEELASGLAETVTAAKEASKEPRPFGDLADRVKASTLAAVAEARREEKARVDRTIADAESRIARATSDLNQALGVFLGAEPIELLGVRVVVDSSADSTSARITYDAQQGISYAYVVSGSQTESFRKPRKVSEFAKGIELQVGLKKQFLRKDLTPDMAKLDDLFIRKLECDVEQVKVSLSSKHADAPELFEIEMWVEDEGEPPTLRHRPQGETAGLQVISANQTMETVGRLEELKAAVIEIAQEPIVVPARKLVNIEVEESAVVTGDLMYELAHRIAIELGPTVAEIAKRSPSDKELALKVEDTGGVRQERYVEKTKLAAHFDNLPEQWKDLLKVLHVT